MNYGGVCRLHRSGAVDLPVVDWADLQLFTAGVSGNATTFPIQLAHLARKPVPSHCH